MRADLIDIFIGNLETKEVHHKNFEVSQCQLSEIKQPTVFESLAEARELNFDLCGHCFRSKN